LFQVLDKRNELPPIMTTTIIPFGESIKVFVGSAAAQSNKMGRLVFTSHIIETGTESWRFKENLTSRGDRGSALLIGVFFGAPRWRSLREMGHMRASRWAHFGGPEGCVRWGL